MNRLIIFSPSPVFFVKENIFYNYNRTFENSTFELDFGDED